MKPHFSRRDFLKIAGALPLSLTLPPHVRKLVSSQQPDAGLKNVIVVVFDAFSAYHLPLYGYPRKTAPNIERLAERAIVYHNHYAGGNFTTPGTASLLTGTLPWTHRAFELNDTVASPFADKNIFAALPSHYRIAYSHNPYVNVFLRQFAEHLDDLVPLGNLMLVSDSLVHSLFPNDEDIADVAWVRSVKKNIYGYSYSLLLSNLYEEYVRAKIASVAPNFPRGIPNIRGDNYFILEEAIDWLERKVGQLPQPYFGYFHFMPPHAPYTPETAFYGAFAGDQYQPPSKPDDLFSPHQPYEELLRKRTAYDEYVANLDREFGRLVDALEKSGQLRDTWLVLTADHGELFERGFRGHGQELLYEGVVRVPLLIFEPGRTRREDIHTPTSAVDVLPTLVHLAGGEPPAWPEGYLLPPFANEALDPNRSLHVVQSQGTDPGRPMGQGTIALIKGSLKLTYFFGYTELAGKTRVELYDVEKDPEELHNLAQSQAGVRDAMLEELKASLATADAPYS